MTGSPDGTPDHPPHRSYSGTRPGHEPQSPAASASHPGPPPSSHDCGRGWSSSLPECNSTAGAYSYRPRPSQPVPNRSATLPSPPARCRKPTLFQGFRSLAGYKPVRPVESSGARPSRRCQQHTNSARPRCRLPSNRSAGHSSPSSPPSQTLPRPCPQLPEQTHWTRYPGRLDVAAQRPVVPAEH